MGKQKPFHWSFFEGTAPSRRQIDPGVAFQLRGLPGGFYYQGPETVDMGKSSSKKEILEIGDLEGGDIEQVKKHIDAILKMVHIEKNESSRWNCQNWALDGFTSLAADKNILDSYYNKAGIKA
ncbi:hypothetical protein diail_8540 [Diaporthe ilicicola]|nr:hypothetical protein diail_8540 [Diaporthe ilicicola]